MEARDELKTKLKTYRLNEKEYEMICSLLGREPNNVEWALFSALWSEHCSYKSSKVHLKKLFNKSERVVQSFGENAGVVDLGQGERVAFKIESHNHPSFIEPYQGAATGVGGILRDIFTMGARPIALANYLCFGEPKAPRMQTLVDGVVRGIGGYGNCVGVPTITGQTEFHSSYNNNILVNAMAVGLFRPGENVFLSKAKGVGNWVVYVGAKTGRDGAHGASMASESFGEDSKAKRPTVQIGDPFYEKLLIESCLEVMAENLVVAIQDMGAAGLTSSSFEMASKGGVGLSLHLDQVPLRDESMSPEDILLSESQERMLLICEPAKFDRIQSIFDRWDLDACKVGEVHEKRTVDLFWHNELLTSIDPDILVENAPQYERPFKKWEAHSEVKSTAELGAEVADVRGTLYKLLRDSRGTSRDWIYRQYDQRVGANTVRDCRDSVGIVRLADSNRSLGVVLGCRPHVMRMDAQIGGADAVIYPALELAAKGFTTLAVTDCLNFGNPEREKIMTEFVASLGAMSKACERLVAPIISGNVSFYNETTGQNITSTPSTGLIGLREEGDLTAIPDSKFVKANNRLYVVRIPIIKSGGYIQEIAKGASKFMGTARRYSGFNIEEAADFVKAVEQIAKSPSIKSSRVVGKFGLAYALGKMCSDKVGAHIPEKSLKAIRPGLNADSLFEEHFYEVIFEVDAYKETLFLETFNLQLDNLKDLEAHALGDTQPDKLNFENFFECRTEILREEYERGWKDNFEGLYAN